MKIVQDYTNVESSASFEVIEDQTNIYNKNADFKDYDSLNLMIMKTTKPVSGINNVSNILDVIFSKTKDRDFFVKKKPHYRTLPNDLSDMEI